MWFLFLTGFNNPQVCNFLSFLFTFAFFIGYTSKEAKLKKINDPCAGSLLASTYSSHAGGSIIKILPTITQVNLLKGS